MNAQLPTKPLDAFPAIHSSDAEEVEHALVGIYGARRLALPGRDAALDVRANHWQSKAISLSYCSYGGNADVEFPEAGFFRQLFPLQGGFAIAIDGKPREVSPTDMPVIRAGASLLNKFHADYEQLVLRVDSSVLTRKLAALLGTVPPRPIEFEPGPSNDRSSALYRLVRHLTNEMDRYGALLGPLVLSELEQSVVTTFLCSNPNNYTDRLTGPQKSVASWQVKRAEEYIEAHWHEPLSVRTLAQVTSTSARSLFFHFKQSRGKSPMEFVKEVRLQHARRILCEGQTSVTETAIACGFGNLGHFAKDYYRQFGERPSETVKRAKMLVGGAC